MKQIFRLFFRLFFKRCALFIAFCLLSPVLMNASPQTKSPTKPIAKPNVLKGCIVSNQLKTIPHFKVYYQGIQTVSNDDGFFSIPLESAEKKESYSLLICKDFVPAFESINTVKNLTMPAKKPYQFFVMQKATMPLIQETIAELKTKARPFSMRSKLLARQIKKQNQLYLQTKRETKKSVSHYTKRLKRLRLRRRKFVAQLKKINGKAAKLKEKYLEFQNATPEKPAIPFWFITKKSLSTKRKSKKRTIPSDSVIVCLNPKTIDTVENWKFALAPNFVTLPRIILKKNLETKNIKRKQSITRSALKSELYSFEQSVFHELKKEAYKTDDKKTNMKISMVQ